jgi:hypothetical protein
MNLQQAKLARLTVQTEREILVNEVMRASLVKWVDCLEVFGEKIVAARNKIMGLPSMFADRLTREEVEQFRKAIYEILTEASKVDVEDVKARNKRLAKYEKASTTIDPDEREQVNGTSLKTQKTQNKPR